MRHLRWNRLFDRSLVVSIGWAKKREAESFPLHDHDFPELFWIEQGTIVEVCNGKKEVLAPGCLRFVRAGDQHEFWGGDKTGGLLANVAFKPRLMDGLAGKSLSLIDSTWWPVKGDSVLRKLSKAELQQVSLWGRDLAGATNEAWAACRFLFNLRHLLQKSPEIQPTGAEPDWLYAARKALEAPENFQRGVAQLASLSGCSAEHLARTVRKVHGMTPTDLVNQARLRWAEERLLYSTDPIMEICLDAGFESLSHFYHLFTAMYGEAPAKYRRRAAPLA